MLPTTAPVLVAVDFSPDSEAAFEWALRVACSFGAPLLVLHVAHDPPAKPGRYAEQGDGLVDLESVAGDLLEAFVAGLRAKHPAIEDLPGFDSRVVVGLPVGRILEVATNEGAQLIVMGGRGRSGLADVLLGSKVERVAGLARIPVAIVRAPRGEPAAEANGLSAVA